MFIYVHIWTCTYSETWGCTQTEAVKENTSTYAPANNANRYLIICIDRTLSEINIRYSFVKLRRGHVVQIRTKEDTFCIKNVQKKPKIKKKIIHMIVAMLHCVICVCDNICLHIYYNSDILNKLHRSLSLFVSLLSLPNRSIRDERRMTSGVALSFLSSLFFHSFFFIMSGSSLSRQHTHTHTHWPNARCRRDDTEMDRVLHSVSHVRLLFSSLSARLLLINLSQPTKLTISVVIVTTLILFLVAAVATRRRRWWRLHHPFRNIGRHIYHCKSFDYDYFVYVPHVSEYDRYKADLLLESR